MYNLRRGNNFNVLFNIKYFLFIICVSFLLYQSIDLLNEFMSGKTVININYGIIRNTTLPAITICPHDLDFRKLAMLNENVSKLYKTYVNNMPNASKVDIGEKQSHFYKAFNEALKIFFNSQSPNINIKNNILENLTPFIDQMNKTIFTTEIARSIAHGNIDNDLLRFDEDYRMISLPMESVIITMNNRTPIVFKCYTLFSHSQSSWNKINIDFAYILILLKLDPYSYPIRPTMTIPILMHSPNTLPIYNYNFINPGYYYIIRYSQWNIERLGKGYDTDCREYNPKQYTRSDCIFDCYQNKVKYYCQTRDIVGSTILKTNIYFEQRNLNLSKCSVSYKLYLQSLKLCEDQCHKECHFTYYSFTISKYIVIDKFQAYFQFSHNSLPDITIRYIPEMPLLTFICNFGGILGMWLGLSFYTIFHDIWKILHVHILSKNIFTNINLKLFIQNKNSRRISPPRNTYS